MMVLPYRAKNPPESFPYVTLGLLLTNVVVYALTTENFLVVREGAVDLFAVSHDTMNLLRLFTQMFLHGSLLHIAGNMLFLWIFGPATESRLGPFKYLGVYLLAGLGGGVLHDAISGVLDPGQFSLGASGAIMGLAGAYLYLFPFATICVFFQWGWRFHLVEWQVQWVVLYFIAFDILNGLLFHGAKMSDGIAHFAHIGGFGAGFLLVMLLRMPRDSEDYSEAQKMRSNVGNDFQSLALHELESLLEGQPDNPKIVQAYVRKAVLQVGGTGHRLALDAMRKHQNILLQGGDPEVVAKSALGIPTEVGTLPLPFYLRLAGNLEQAALLPLADRMYRYIHQLEEKAPETELALARLGRLLERRREMQTAAAVYQEQLRLFPNGESAALARSAVQRLGGAQNLVFSPGSGAQHHPLAADSSLATVTGARPLTPAPPIVAPPKPTSDDLAPVGNWKQSSDSADDDLTPVGS